MTNVAASYNRWARQYDANANRTRDLERIAAQTLLGGQSFRHVIELGCGTGKNTEWLLRLSEIMTCIDFSDEMLAIARRKISSENVTFRTFDISAPWDIPDASSDLVTSSLVLEHIRDLNPIFIEAYRVLKPGGRFYVCELHPFKQYDGTKARFDENGVRHEVDVFLHHVSDFTAAASRACFALAELREWFDTETPGELPRLISFVFVK